MVVEVGEEAQCSHIVTFKTKDLVKIEQLSLQTLTPAEFLALLHKHA